MNKKNKLFSLPRWKEIPKAEVVGQQDVSIDKKISATKNIIEITKEMCNQGKFKSTEPLEEYIQKLEIELEDLMDKRRESS